MEHLKFKHPFSLLVAGPSSSGKTVWVRRLLSHYRDLTTILKEPLRVLWFYGEYQQLFLEKIPSVSVEYHKGILPIIEIIERNPQLIVIDDLMSEVGDDRRLSNLFTKESHHLGISVVFIVQNLFHRGKEIRNVSLNSKYIVLMKNPRDLMQAMNFGRQAYPHKLRFFNEVFEDATHSPYSYLVVDMTLDTPDELRLRSRIFPEETIKGISEPIVYMPKDVKRI